MAGLDIATVIELLGHSTFKMTLRYAHLAPTHKVKVEDIGDQVLTTSDFLCNGRGKGEFRIILSTLFIYHYRMGNP